jgi:PAT family beta-lactamase induction signal transducer AmpG
MNPKRRPDWLETLHAFTHPRVVTMLFLGFSAGIPLMLIFSSLGLWLREAGIERAVVTYFSWAALGYSFKFVWAPLVDQLPLPWLTRIMGRRRAWMLLAQLLVIISIALIGSIDPQASERSLSIMAGAAVLLGFSAATQDIVIDAYRIESAKMELQALMSATYIAGYRIGMLLSGAGTLYLASWYGSSSETYVYQAWQYAYALMALAMLVGVTTTLIVREPETNSSNSYLHSAEAYARFVLLFLTAVGGFVTCFYFSGAWADQAKTSLGLYLTNQYLSGFIIETLRLALAILVSWVMAVAVIKAGMVDRVTLEQTYILPVRDFFSRYGLSLAWLLLALIGLYRISDIVLGVISNVFYQDLGFSKTEIANVVKTFGLLMTIVGGFVGGILAMRYGVMRILFLGAVLSSATNLMFMHLASTGYDMTWLYIVISADNLSAGIASAAFVAFLSSLTNISFTAMQFAIFTSLMTLLPKILGGYSGTMVDAMGYSNFFLITALMGIPVLILIVAASRRNQFSFKLA